jgi:Tol biopolymer transport system component
MALPLVRHARPAAWLLVTAVLLLCASPAQAQYFGRNKVQYRDFDFEVLRTEHFDIYYYPEAREGIDISARLAERWHARLERVFGHQLRGRQPLVLYASHPHFEQTNTIPGEIGESTGGVTEPLRRRIILPLGGPLRETDHVIGHELVHAFQFDITSRTNAASGANAGINQLPLWFIEGMAEYLSIGPVDPHTAMWMRDAIRAETLPPIDKLDSPEYFPYRWGQAFWAYVAGRWGDGVIPKMLSLGGAVGDYRIAIERVLGVKLDELSNDWHAALRKAYQPVLQSTTPPNEVGRVVLSGGGGLGGELNVGPAISPDGRWVSFLSERGLFSIDLFVADVSTGKVIHRLTSTASDPHLASLQFIHSAGSWAPDNRRLAVATVIEGQGALVIYDAQRGSKEQELKIEELDEIFNPSWAPDGRAVVFTGMSRGLTDLYVFDLEAAKLRRLTEDAYADIQPAWSPDGQAIAFATDRFTSNLDTLQIGNYTLGLIDVQSAAIRQAGAFTGGKNINPQWGPGGALFFISDRDGISNIYRMTVGSDAAGITQLTSISTGVSGITATSPALSVATQAGMAMFSVYDGGNYNVHALEVGSATAAPGVTLTEVAEPAAGTLPPLDRVPSDVVTLLTDPSFGLPPSQQYDVTSYNSGLSLEAVGPLTVSAGADRYGAAFSGGIALLFSDVLGNQSLVTAFQINSGVTGSFSVRDSAVQVAYLNRTHRWDWGLIGGQFPYLSGGFQSGIGTVNGEQALIDQTIVFRQTERVGSALAAYPFNRADRVEFQGGISQITFDQIIRTEAYSLRTGQLIADDTEETSLGDSLTLATSSAALVHDTSLFGATSPIQGQRYRLEATPNLGSINFTSILADYRRYFMPVSFYTIAGRFMHYGRYGSGSSDARLRPLYIGYPNMIRGYDMYSLSPRESLTFDELQGTRMLVANLEFRFPLLRPFGATSRMYGPLPVEIALFTDAGVAWDHLTTPKVFGGDRKGVASAGIAARTNVFGFLIMEFDVAKPFQRPEEGWTFQFHVTPGF